MPLHDLVSSTVAISRLPTDEVLRILESMPIHDAAPWNAILGSYLRDGDRLSAYRLFDRMPLRNLISWNTLLTASIEEGSSPLERIFHSMPKRNSVSWNALLAAYAQRGQMSQAANVLDLMPERSVVSWTVMILACCACVDSATWMLQSMPAHSLVTWTTMLAVYAQLGHPDRAKILFDKMPYRDLVCWNTLIAAYGHGGEVDLVPRVFDLMPMRDLIAWSACIAANSCCGRLWDSFSLFWAMVLQGIAPNEVVLQCILSCCSHAGDLDAGIHCFRSMIVDHALDLSKEHYSCIVDLLGRAGQLGPARDLLEHMPFVPDVEWTSLTIHHYSSHTWRAGKWSLILPPGQIVLDAAFA
ncbi:hypothetical protein SELMODRAFT_131822 [Selaginella moellendorffii]|uniref:Pentatricopeptide repeat-containing protein n=2 Tax=Selaginella moellendorffii TaxID=88036 RepID=D8T4L6_SELML|nr:hypothetical protein SELMODRAFT_131822 [Selaginella moellendorffii]